jgi:anti-sigma factor RsiW
MTQLNGKETMTQSSSLSPDDRTNLVAYLDGELDGQSSSALEALLQKDPQARLEADHLRRTWDLLDYLPRPDPSPSFTHRTLERIADERPVSRVARPIPWRPIGLGVGWAAAVLVVGALGFGGGKFLPRSSLPPAIDSAESAEGEDQELVRDFRVIQNRRLYEHVDNIRFLESLADPNDPDLFGDENLGL